jgi:hypothetical protein
MRIISRLLTAFAPLFVFFSPAQAQRIRPDDQGSITSYTIITPQGPVTQNTEGGPEAGFVFLPVSFAVTDYFADFDLGGLPAETITAATLDLTIEADPAYAGRQDPNQALELDLFYNPQTNNPGADPSQFDNLNSGDLVGAVDLPLLLLQADHRYSIGLNPLGIEDLNGATGEVTLSGVLDSVGTSPVDSFVIDISKPKLKVAVAVPEPAEGLLLFGGVLGLGLVRRFLAKKVRPEWLTPHANSKRLRIPARTYPRDKAGGSYMLCASKVKGYAVSSFVCQSGGTELDQACLNSSANFPRYQELVMPDA